MSDILFHASTNKDLTVIRPQRTLSKDEYIGDFVFATPNRLYALMYLAPNEAGAKLMETESRQPYIVISGTPGRYKELDRGGAVYQLSGEPFRPSPQKELDESEMVSATSVTPLSKEIFSSSLDALLDAGVRVYFVDDDTFNRLLEAHGAMDREVAKLQAYTGSMEYPYQIVTFFDREPAIGEYVYQGENGWYPQLALKRRFAFDGINEEEGVAKVEEFIRSTEPFTVTFGSRIRPERMPVDVIEVVDSPRVTAFHRDFIRFMGRSILSRFPEREDENYYPHMTVTWKDADVVPADNFTYQRRNVTRVWMLKDDGEDSRAYKAMDLKDD